MKERDNLELVVGVFVFLGLVILFTIVFSISGTYILRPGIYRIKAQFTYVAGLRKGSPVRLAGRPIGEVGKFETLIDSQTGRSVVEVTMYVDKAAKIREKARAEIYGTSFALAEPTVEIVQGGNEDGDFVKDGTLIRGIDPAVLDILVAEAQKAVTHARAIVEQVDATLKDPEMQNVFRETAINLRNVTRSLNEILSKNQSDISDTLTNLDASVKKLRDTLDHIEKGEGTVGKLVYTEDLYNELVEFVKDLKAHPWKLLQKEEGKGKKFVIF